MDHCPPDVKRSYILCLSDIPVLFGQGSMTLNKEETAIGRNRQVKVKGARSRDVSSGQKDRGSSIYFVQGDLVEIKTAHIEHLKSTPAISEGFHVTAPIPTTVKLGFDLCPPRSVQPTSPTGTQGERIIQHGIGVPRPLVGRPGFSGELGSTSHICGHYSITLC